MGVNYTVSNYFNATCTVAGFLGLTYGKYMSVDIDATVIMEYENFLPFLLPFQNDTTNTDFNNFITSNPLILEQYADFLMYTLPKPRYAYYESSNFETIQNQITAITNEITKNLGFYEPRVYMGLLTTMQLLSTATLLLGLIFSIIVILFIVISILLIYSLLMISIETKTFENGVLRLVGLTKINCVSMILVQSLLFVIPSIILGYAVSFPILQQIYKYLFKGQSGVHIPPVPTADATLLAVALGLFIPLFSAIVPI